LSSGYPAVLGIFNAKSKYLIMRGTFNAKNVNDWVNSIVTGKEHSLDYKVLPKLGNKVDRWDGKDHKPAYSDDDL